MPKLWNETIDAHRREVRAAILDTTATLVAEYGLRGVTMSAIAERAGIGRATLYKYFSDVESILTAWHEQQMAGHLAEIAEIRDRAGAPAERLAVVLEAFAVRSRRSQGHDSAIAATLHRGRHMTAAEQHVHTMIRGLIAEGAAAGSIRADVSAAELASYCVHALTAAETSTSTAAVRRLVEVIMSGLRLAP
ncbi:TetR/AcrR family transcriptional regulator [Nocardia uniformis]|uniref:TetR/AcrR family transcriptional regulator n=1 Tax=Nocardia uniformis TaxID=53432 RepID=A0A849CBR1_9NOCA|nr:TetR/AcrR family transcriptional regulator [Nocardia uniformis]NNH76074.1 TetR/AcrR family transcriptional regulator [Nocardia uniformis]